MKRIAYILFVVIAFTACKDKTKFTVDGKFQNPGTENKVYLYGLANNNMQLLDSTVLSEKGEFKFANSAPENPAVVRAILSILISLEIEFLPKAILSNWILSLIIGFVTSTILSNLPGRIIAGSS